MKVSGIYEQNPQNTGQKQNYFTSAKQEASKEQKPGTELLPAELKSTTFSPTFPLFFSICDICSSRATLKTRNNLNSQTAVCHI